MRMCLIMTHLRLMTLSLTVIAVCQQASRRPSNAARSCAKRGPERNALWCLQTLKNGINWLRVLLIGITSYRSLKFGGKSQIALSSGHERDTYHYHGAS